MKNKHRFFVLVVVLCLVCMVLFVGWMVKLGMDGSERVVNEGDLPKLELYLNDVTLDEFKNGEKETKYTGNVLRVDDNGRIFAFDNVEIKGRGNSTWTQVKKPFQIKFGQKEDLLGLGRAKTWILLANIFDDSHVRNDVAYKIAEMLQMPFTGRGKFVELSVDGEWQGLYYLTNKVEISKNSVDIRDDYGVLFELDNLWAGEEGYETSGGDRLVLKDAVFEGDSAMLAEAVGDFLQDYEALEKAVVEGDFERASELIDMDSFVKYYLISEFSVDPDAYASSFYMYKNGLEDKIYAGPVWDYDFAFGNKKWYPEAEEGVYSPFRTMVRKDITMSGAEEGYSKLMYYLMDMPGFREIVARVFSEQMSGRKNELLYYIYKMASKIHYVAIADGVHWGEENFNKEVTYLLEWVADRFDYFERIYGRKDGGVIWQGVWEF